MLKQFEDKMEKSLDSLESEYANIRAGRANPNILNKIKVEYYGVPTPLQQVGNVVNIVVNIRHIMQVCQMKPSADCIGVTKVQ